MLACTVVKIAPPFSSDDLKHGLTMSQAADMVRLSERQLWQRQLAFERARPPARSRQRGPAVAAPADAAGQRLEALCARRHHDVHLG